MVLVNSLPDYLLDYRTLPVLFPSLRSWVLLNLAAALPWQKEPAKAEGQPLAQGFQCLWQRVSPLLRQVHSWLPKGTRWRRGCRSGDHPPVKCISNYPFKSCICLIPFYSTTCTSSSILQSKLVFSGKQICHSLNSFKEGNKWVMLSKLPK